MSSHINKRISFFQKIIIFLIIGILIFILFVWYSDFSINHGYSLLETPMVRSCQVDSDCQWFANSCVNKNFQPKKQEIISSAFPLWEFNNNSCFCKNYIITNLCKTK